MTRTRLAETIVEAPCMLAHRLWWVPLLNRSTLLTCPVAWLTSHSPRFARWYFNLP